VAIPVDQSDDPLAKYCVEQGWMVYRGLQADVLDRYFHAAILGDADYVVRVTADCPLIDPGVINDVVRKLDMPGVDFVSNSIEPSFPHGLDCQAFTMDLLNRAHAEATAAFDREHVVPWMMNAPGVKRVNVKAPENLSQYRLTVDWPEDLELVRAIFEAFRERVFFTTADMISLLRRRPELMAINAHRRVA
jgi:spore coat polysaccharide biosynthesis protein SpsF (cytidylyltransferase family)